MKRHAKATLVALTIASVIGIGVIMADAQEQKPEGNGIVAQNGTPAYHAQLDRVRTAIGHGDQARVNDEMVTLLGILEEQPMSTPDHSKHVTSNGSSLTNDMMDVLRIQDNRAGNSF